MACVDPSLQFDDESFALQLQLEEIEAQQLDSAPEVPPRPNKPTVQEIKAITTSLVNLSAEERELYNANAG
ncbi:hypothetical protein IFR05_001184 [Cadophora sp. M221]|nr:hypothetical protein IFR05_001184 [Cadophora sp. M221]